MAAVESRNWPTAARVYYGHLRSADVKYVGSRILVGNEPVSMAINRPAVRVVVERPEISSHGSVGHECLACETGVRGVVDIQSSRQGGDVDDAEQTECAGRVDVDVHGPDV